MACPLDTNVVSELYKQRPRQEVLNFIGQQPEQELFLTTLSLVEISLGISRPSDEVRKLELTDWLTHVLRPRFKRRVLGPDEAVLFRWVSLMQRGRRNHTYSQPDLLLAALAIEHNLTLVTRNTRDFSSIPDLQLFNPWE